MIELKLQKFAEGEAASSAPAAEAGSAPQQTEQAAPIQNTGETAAAAALHEYRQNRQKQGKRVYEQAANMPTAAQQPLKTEPERPASAEEQKPIDKAQAFDELVKGEYKAEFDQMMQTAIKNRLKGRADAEAELSKRDAEQSKLTPMLDALYKKNGVQQGDLDALIQKIMNDDDALEEEALERGMSVESLRQLKALEHETSNLRKEAEARQRQEATNRHIQGLFEQGEELKKLYPDFDLRAELDNPDFFRLTSPNVGIDVRTAYEVIHNEAVQTRMAAAIANRTASDMSRAIQSGSKRPAENGVTTPGNALSLSDDPANWTRAQRNAMVARMKAGR